jgi:hypothetical protein
MPPVSKSKKMAKLSIATMNGTKRPRKRRRQTGHDCRTAPEIFCQEAGASKADISQRTPMTTRSKTLVTDALTDAMHKLERLSPF